MDRCRRRRRPTSTPIRSAWPGRRTRAFVEFCTSDPVRYQLLFQRTIPDFDTVARELRGRGRGLRADERAARRRRRRRPGDARPVDRDADRPHRPADLQRSRRRPLDATRRPRRRHVVGRIRATTTTTTESETGMTTMTTTDVTTIPTDRPSRGDGAPGDRARSGARDFCARSIRATGRRQTDCPDWDVRRMWLHVLGAMRGRGIDAGEHPPDARRPQASQGVRRVARSRLVRRAGRRTVELSPDELVDRLERGRPEDRQGSRTRPAARCGR